MGRVLVPLAGVQGIGSGSEHSETTILLNSGYAHCCLPPLPHPPPPSCSAQSCIYQTASCSDPLPGPQTAFWMLGKGTHAGFFLALEGVPVAGPEPLQPALSGDRPALNVLGSFRSALPNFLLLSRSPAHKRGNMSVQRRYRFGLIRVCIQEPRKDIIAKDPQKSNPVCGEGTQEVQAPGTSQKDWQV